MYLVLCRGQMCSGSSRDLIGEDLTGLVMGHALSHVSSQMLHLLIEVPKVEDVYHNIGSEAS